MVVMIYGVGLFGVITGALATWVIEKISGVTEEDHAATKADIETLHAEIAELKAMLAIRMGDGTVHHPPEELTQEFLPLTAILMLVPKKTSTSPNNQWNCWKKLSRRSR